MSDTSAAATTCARRGGSAAARRGFSCRGSDPNGDAVLIACNPSAGAAGLPIRDDAEGRAARGRDRSIQAPRRAARAGAVGIAATDTVAAPAPKKGPRVAVTPSNHVDAATRLQKKARGHRNER